ncbi:unnamed protein product [Effrenium voratum]|nr:unnamed protein product [Effrenium voratum]
MPWAPHHTMRRMLPGAFERVTGYAGGEFGDSIRTAQLAPSPTSGGERPRTDGESGNSFQAASGGYAGGEFGDSIRTAQLAPSPTSGGERPRTDGESGNSFQAASGGYAGGEFGDSIRTAQLAPSPTSGEPAFIQMPNWGQHYSQPDPGHPQGSRTPGELKILLAQQRNTARQHAQTLPSKPSRAGQNHVFKDRKLADIYRDVVQVLLPNLAEVQRLEERQPHVPDADQRVRRAAFCRTENFTSDGSADDQGPLQVWILSEHFDPYMHKLDCTFQKHVVTPTFQHSTQFLLAVDTTKVKEFKSRAEAMIKTKLPKKDVELADAGFAYIRTPIFAHANSPHDRST